MKFAFYSAALGDLPLAEVTEWGRQAGFDGVEIDIRRHVKDPTGTANAVEIARGAGLEVCALTVFGNLLDQNDSERDRLATWRGEFWPKPQKPACRYWLFSQGPDRKLAWHTPKTPTADTFPHPL